jgi:hypothetical protein
MAWLTPISKFLFTQQQNKNVPYVNGQWRTFGKLYALANMLFGEIIIAGV